MELYLYHNGVGIRGQIFSIIPDEQARNNKISRENWQFTYEDAREKLSRLYPTLDA